MGRDGNYLVSPVDSHTYECQESEESEEESDEVEESDEAKVTAGISTEEHVPIEVPGFPRPIVRQRALVRTARSSDDRKYN